MVKQFFQDSKFLLQKYVKDFGCSPVDQAKMPEDL